MTFTLIGNPAYAGQAPRPLKATCHDGSPFLTIRCDCGADLHMHESQIAHAPAGVPLAARCPGCGDHLMLGDVPRDAFARMRAEGWIA